MVNRQSGEVSIQGVSGRVYTLKNSFKGMAAVEELFNMNFNEVAKLSDGGSMRHTRALIWSLFQQREPTFTLEDIDEFVDDCGGMSAVAVKVLEALKASMPDPKDVKAMGVTENPPAAQANPKPRRTGEPSNSRPGASA